MIKSHGTHNDSLYQHLLNSSLKSSTTLLGLIQTGYLKYQVGMIVIFPFNI